MLSPASVGAKDKRLQPGAVCPLFYALWVRPNKVKLPWRQALTPGLRVDDVEVTTELLEHAQDVPLGQLVLIGDCVLLVVLRHILDTLV